MTRGGSAAVALEMASLRQQLRRAAGNVKRLQELVRLAEQHDSPLAADAQALSEVYGLAMRAFGPVPLATAPDEYAELCRKRLAALRAADPAEARIFEAFMAHHGIQAAGTAPAAAPAATPPPPALLPARARASGRGL